MRRDREDELDLADVGEHGHASGSANLRRAVVPKGLVRTFLPIWFRFTFRGPIHESAVGSEWLARKLASLPGVSEPVLPSSRSALAPLIVPKRSTSRVVSGAMVPVGGVGH